MTEEEAQLLADLDPCPMSCGRTTEDPYGGPCKACWAEVVAKYRSPCTTAHLLAASYADHPDYREEWRPSA